MQTRQRLFEQRLSRQRLFCVLALLLLALLPCLPASAQQPSPPELGKGAFGKISAVSAASITVSFLDGGSATFTLSASTPITLDKAASTLGALSAGQFAAVTSTDGATATKIDARMHLRPPPAGPPPNGPPPD